MVRNASFVVLARVWSIALWIALTPFVLHHLGPERFGVWSLLFLLSGYLTTFDLGLGSSVVKFTAQYAAAQDWDRLDAILYTVTRLYVGIGVIWIVALVALSGGFLGWLHIPQVYRGEVRFALITSGVIFVFANLISIGTGVLNGLQRMGAANGIVVVASIPQALILWIGLARGDGLYAVVASTAALWAGIGVLTMVSLRALASQLRWPRRVARGEGGSWLRFSSLMQVANLLVLTQQQLDKVLLGAWIGLAAVTDFELGYRVANAAQSLPVLTLVPLLPVFADIGAKGDRERLRLTCRRGTALLLAAAFGLAACSIPAAPLAMRSWMGSGYPHARDLSQWLLAGYSINLCTGVATAAARGSGRPDLELLPAAIGIAVHLAASALWIPRWGVVGVGPAFCLGMLVWSVLYLARFTRWLDEDPGRLWWPALLPSLLALGPGMLVGYFVSARWPDAWAQSRIGALAGAAVVAIPAGGIFFAIWWITRRWFRSPGPVSGARGSSGTGPQIA